MEARAFVCFVLESEAIAAVLAKIQYNSLILIDADNGEDMSSRSPSGQCSVSLPRKAGYDKVPFL
jgi:hypothetical protein